MSHSIILHPDPGEVTATCSCGNFTASFDGEEVPLSLVNQSVAPHLRPEMEKVLKELLKIISVKDILKMITSVRKK